MALIEAISMWVLFILFASYSVSSSAEDLLAATSRFLLIDLALLLFGVSLLDNAMLQLLLSLIDQRLGVLFSLSCAFRFFPSWRTMPFARDEHIDRAISFDHLHPGPN